MIPLVTPFGCALDDNWREQLITQWARLARIKIIRPGTSGGRPGSMMFWLAGVVLCGVDKRHILLAFSPVSLIS
jgi:hypothetical protein